MAKTGKKTGTAASTPPARPQLYYRLHSLLHTVRSIAQHEDQLCGLLTEVETSGGLNADVGEELRNLLEEIPSCSYQGDLSALWEALDGAGAAPKPAPAAPRRPRSKVKAAAKPAPSTVVRAKKGTVRASVKSAAIPRSTAKRPATASAAGNVRRPRPGVATGPTKRATARATSRTAARAPRRRSA